MKNQFKKIALFLFSVFLLYNCNNKKTEICNCENIKLNHLWEIISTDSMYYEFYFDNYQQFLFKERYGASILANKDTSIFNNFLRKMCNTNDLIIQGKEVERYFSSWIPKKIKIKSVKPIGDFIYRISKDISTNYELYNNEVNDRYFKYKYGGAMECDTPKIIEEIIIKY